MHVALGCLSWDGSLFTIPLHPEIVAGGYGVVGAQPYDLLEQLAVKASASRRA